MARRPPDSRAHRGGELSPVGPSAQTLKALKLMNADGSVSADMRRKLKQVEHAIAIVAPLLAPDGALARTPSIWDLNCGSSYLGLLLLDDLRRTRGVEGRLIGVDRDPARIDACRRRAAAAGFESAEFVHGDSNAFKSDGSPDLVLSLHGCDRATDAALVRATAAAAAAIAVAPCCHRELRTLLARDGRHAPFLRDGVIANDYAALLTDASRADALRAAGYRTEVVEFVPAEHTPMNRLILARRAPRRDANAHARVLRVAADCSGPPSFLAVLPDAE